MIHVLRSLQAWPLSRVTDIRIFANYHVRVYLSASLLHARGQSCLHSVSICCIIMVGSRHLRTYVHFHTTTKVIIDSSLGLICLEVVWLNRPRLGHLTLNLKKNFILPPKFVMGIWSFNGIKLNSYQFYFLRNTASIDINQLHQIHSNLLLFAGPSLAHLFGSMGVLH